MFDTKKIVVLTIIVAIFLLAVTKTNLLTIASENVYVQGEVQKYFSRCNPCQTNIVISHEPNFFQTVKFSILTDFNELTTTSVKFGCVPLGTSHTSSRSADCQAGGFNDYATSLPGYSGPYWCSNNPDVIKCWGYVPLTASQITCSLDNQVVFQRRNDGIQTVGTNSETSNLATILNKFVPVTDQISMALICRADGNGGRYEVSSTPTVLETTTTQEPPKIEAPTQPTMLPQVPPVSEVPQLEAIGSVNIIVLKAQTFWQSIVAFFQNLLKAITG